MQGRGRIGVGRGAGQGWDRVQAGGAGMDRLGCRQGWDRGWPGGRGWPGCRGR